MPKFCDICSGSKRIKLPTYSDMSVAATKTSVPMVGFKEFDCPQCVPKVPYRKVRATKAVARPDANEFGRFQTIIERRLAAQFGEYLYKEGLIKFTTDSLDNFTNPTITVTAHLGVVTPDNTERAGATPEFAYVENVAPMEQLARIERQKQERKRRKEGGPTFDPDPGENIDGSVGIDFGLLNAQAQERKSVFGPKKSARELAAEQRAKAEDRINSRFSGIDFGDE